jgi:hypothetical protein
VNYRSQIRLIEREIALYRVGMSVPLIPILSSSAVASIMVFDEQAQCSDSLTSLSRGTQSLLSADFVPMASRKSASAFQLNYKTQLCLNWEMGYCEFGEKCAFAHGKVELKQTVQKSNKYKTKRCKQFYAQGFCVYGPRCQFIHEKLPSLKDLPTAANSRRNSVEEQVTRRLPVFLRLAEGEACA